MQKTALEIVYNAYELLGLKAEHDTNFSAEKADYGFNTLVAMMDMWRLDNNLAQNWDALTSITLTPNQETYTVGAGGEIDTIFQRPEAISKAFVQSGNKTYPMQQVTADEYYRAPRTIATTTTFPFTYFYSPSYPLAHLTMYPKPSAAITFTIMYPAVIEAPATIDTVVTYGPGYIQTLTFCLAQLLAVTYNIDSPKVDQAATQFKQNIRNSRKRRIPNALIDPACTVRGSAGSNLASTPGTMYDISSNSIRGSF